MTELKGKTALISGGLGDIGSAIGQVLAEAGADIILWDIKEDGDSEKTLSLIKKTGQSVVFKKVDITKPDAIDAALKEASQNVAVPDLIIPNAGIVLLRENGADSVKKWQKVLDINLNGAYYMALAAASVLKKHKKPGRIIFTGSVAAHLPNINFISYCVSKAGLRMLMKCMALDLAPHGILVNEVAPGNVEAGLSKKIFEKDPSKREASLKTIPLGSHISAREVAMQVLHLCDPDNIQMTGSTLLLDGGISL